MTTTHAPDVLPFASQVALLRGAPWRRLAVLGDSIAEGVREPYPGYRDISWIDRIAEPLHAVVPGLTVMNMGTRDLLAREVRERQLDPAIGFRPELAIVAAGGNDALRRSFIPEHVAAELEAIVGPLRQEGADVLMIELLDIVASGLVPPDQAGPLDDRMRALAEVTRAVADRHGALLVEMRGHPASADPDIYSSDRLHLNARGHAIVGSEAVRVLSAALRGSTRQPETPGDGPIAIELSDEEVLADLCWPHPPPGRWPLEQDKSASIDALPRSAPPADRRRRAA
jgi:lysophospholipase L1-like esterase